MTIAIIIHGITTIAINGIVKLTTEAFVMSGRGWRWTMSTTAIAIIAFWLGSVFGAFVMGLFGFDTFED